MAHFNVYAEMTGATKSASSERPTVPSRNERSVNYGAPPLMALAKIGIVPQ